MSENTSNPVEILLVEDEPGMTEGLKRVLKCAGYTVTAIENYKTGLEEGLEKKDVWNLAIIDLELGNEAEGKEFSGITLIKEFRKKDCRFPIIVYSGNTYYDVSLSDVDKQVIAAGMERTNPVVTRIVNKPEHKLTWSKRQNIENLKKFHEGLLGEVKNLTDNYTPPEKLSRGPITLCVYPREVWVRGKEVRFTNYEHGYLYELMISREPVDVDHFIDVAHSKDAVTLERRKGRVEKHISNIRKKLQGAGLIAEEELFPILYDGTNQGYKLAWNYGERDMNNA